MIELTQDKPDTRVLLEPGRTRPLPLSSSHVRADQHSLFPAREAALQPGGEEVEGTEAGEEGVEEEGARDINEETHLVRNSASIWATEDIFWFGKQLFLMTTGLEERQSREVC